MRLIRTLLTGIALLGLALAEQVAAEESAQLRKILGEAVQSAIAAPNDVWKAVLLFGIGDIQERMGDQPGAARTSEAMQNLMTTFQEGAEKSLAEYFLQMARVQITVKAGVTKEALETAAAIKDDYQRAEVLRNLATEQAKAGDRAGAARTFAQALRAALAVRGVSQLAIAVQFVAGAQAEAGETQGALRTLATLNEYDKQGGVREIAQGQVRAGDVKSALQTVAGIQSPMWKGMVLRHVTAAQARAGNVAEALRTARAIDWDSSRATALREIVQAQAGAGDLDGALQTAGTIQDKKETAIAMAAIALAHTKAGDRSAAAKAFQQALKTAASLDSQSDKSVALAAIAKAQAGAGDLDGSRQTIARIPADHRDGYASELVRLHAETGAFKSALQVAGSIQMGPNKAKAMAFIASAQARAGLADEALVWATTQSPELVKANALAGVAAGMLERMETRHGNRKRPAAAARSQPPAQDTRPPARETAAPPTQREQGQPSPGGFLIVETRPADAQIFLDGELLGSAGQLVSHGLPVTAGQHVVQIVAPGFKRYTTQFVTDPNFPTRIRVELTPE